MLFTGTYRRALEEKLRLPIPKPFREQLAEGKPLYLTPGLDGCLALYPPEAFAALGERLAASSPAAREVRDYSRMFFAQSACLAPDRQWRVRIPVELSQWAGLEGEVVIAGVRDHIEIWSAAKWDEYVARCDSQYDHLAEIAFAPVQTIVPQNSASTNVAQSGEISTPRPK